MQFESPLVTFIAFVLQNQFATLNVPKKESSEIEGPSINNSYGFKVSLQNLQDAKALHEVPSSILIIQSFRFLRSTDLKHDSHDEEYAV